MNYIHFAGWATWGQWSVCSATCSGGNQIAIRECLHGNAGESGCIGDQEKMQSCNEASCNGENLLEYLYLLF